MHKRLLSALAAVFALFGAGTNATAENFEIAPSQVTTISGDTPDDVLYNEGATEWRINYGKISGGTFAIGTAGSSSVALVKVDASDYSGQEITKAVLKFHSYCTVAGKNSQIHVATVEGGDIDLSQATWTSVTSSGSAVTDVYTSDEWVKESGADLEAIVTDYFLADEDKILTFGLFTGTAREQAISNISLVLYTGEQPVYTYTVNATDGTNTLKVLSEDKNNEGTSITVAYPRYILGADGTLYKKEPTNKEYNHKFTLNENGQTENLEYTAVGTDVKFLIEGEDIEGAQVISDGNVAVRASNSKTGYNDEQDLTVATLPAGKYKMVAGIFDAGKTASAQFNFNCGSTTIFTAVAPNTNLGEVTSEEFSLTANSNTITLAAGGGSSQKSIDYVYFQKTGDVEITEPSYATGKLVLADIEGITAGSIADGTVLDGGEFTVTVDGDGEFRTYNGNWYLDITNGTLTFKGVDGKHINKIVLDCTGTWGIVKADVGTLDGTTKTWTGDAETVTFTFSVFQSTFTGFTVGDYVEPATEVANIGALSTIESGENINLALNGAKVTFVKDDIAFIEDETGAIKLSNIGLELTANTALTGNLYATYARGSIPQLSANGQTASSEFTAEQTTVTPTLATVQGLNGMQYTNRLIKLVGSMSVEGNWLSFGGTSVWIDDAFGVLPADYSWPANIGSILAIGGSDGAAQEVYPVSADDIVDAANVQPEVAANIAALKDMPTGIDVELKLEGAVVTVDETVEASTEEPGGDEEPGIDPYAEGERTIIIEDATGAVAINASVAEALAETFTGDGISLTGSLIATLSNNYGDISLGANDKTATSQITTEAAEPVATVMGVAESKAAENSLRLIQYADVTITYDEATTTYTIAQGEETITLVDKFQKMEYADGAMVLPTEPTTISGIVFHDVNTDTYEFWPTAIASAEPETVYKEVTETEVFLPTEENVAAAQQEGWLTGAAARVDNKKGNIDPATGETLESATAFPGVGVKSGNSEKTLVIYVTGVDAVTGYGVTTSSGESRSLVITATPADGGEAVTATAESAPNTTAVATVELDKSKKYMIDFTGVNTDGSGGDVAVHGVKLTVAKAEPQEYRKWDFTTWSETTKENLEAEAKNYIDGPAPEGTETGWRRYEKDGAEWTEADGLKDPYTIYWYGSYINEPTELKANGETIAETAGLLFNNVTKLNNTVALAIDYPQTSIGTYAGGSYLWLNGTDLQFTIPAVQPGQKILMEIESHKNTGDNARGVRLSVDGTEIGEGIPVEKTSYEWIVPETLGTDPVDVLVTSTSGCHIYLIEVGNADLISVGINEVNTNVDTDNNNVYTINGVMVRKAGESLDGLAKGLYIIGGKKVVIK